MRSITVSDASGNFSALLEAVEQGEHIIITREDRPIAAVAPARPHTGADLRAALAVSEPPDERFEHGIEAAMGLVVDETGTARVDGSRPRLDGSRVDESRTAEPHAGAPWGGR